MGFNGRLENVKVGDRVCMAGRGTANLVHRHGTVERLTKTMIIVAYAYKNRSLEARYRFNGREVGMSDYGGSYVDTVCQRKPKTS